MKKVNEKELIGRKGFCCGIILEDKICGQIINKTQRILCYNCFNKLNIKKKPSI